MNIQHSSPCPTSLRCEYLTNPLAVESNHPRLSWEPTATQTAWQVIVTSGGDDVWNSGRVDSSESVGIRCGIKDLFPLTRYNWRMRTWDAKNAVSPWSDPAWFGTGPDGAGWTWESSSDHRSEIAASWIALSQTSPWREDESTPSPMVRREFDLAELPSRAVLFASALGLYEARLNGQRVGDQVLAPEWTDYGRRVQYQAIEVTGLLQSGPNALGAILGQGWYAGRIGMAAGFHNVSRGVYGRCLGFIAWLHLEFPDGRIETVVTNGTWKATDRGPIRASDLLDGEVYDSRHEVRGWDAPGFDDSAWLKVRTLKGPELSPQVNEPIRVTRRIPAREIQEIGPGVRIFDCGQNVAGWCALRLSGADSGQEIVLRHGEVLNPDGTLYLENMRGAHPVDRFFCSGGGEEKFEPRFTYHGFRYVEISGLPPKPDSVEVTVCVVHSNPAETCTFASSDPVLDRVVDAIQWTQRGNMHSVLTDCPQRDERLGWTGDAQVFSQTAIFNMDMAAFLTKWMRDLREAQAEDGRFPDFAPHPYDPNQRFSGNPGWADCGVIVPWRMYVNYGDTEILKSMFEPARRYVEWSLRGNPDLIWKNARQMTPLWYGDWLNADTFVGLPDIPKSGGAVPKELYSTAFFAHSTELVSKMARVLGLAAEAEQFGDLAHRIRAAFNRAFVAEDGRILGETQAGYALALHFDILPEAIRKVAASHMVAALQPYRGSLSTGIQSTVRLMLELSRFGYHREAYAILMRSEMPSWRYMVEHGGTTIWERWDGWVEGRGFQNPGMNSFNHYAIGAVGEWIYRTVGGINPDENAPGWKHFFVRPIPGGGLTSVSMGYQSIRGPIRSEWNLEQEVFSLKVSVPPNTTATVELPDGSVHSPMGAGEHHFTCHCKSHHRNHLDN